MAKNFIETIMDKVRKATGGGDGTTAAGGESATKEPPAPGWIKLTALLTGVLAAVAGFLAVRSTNLANDAIYRSNQGVLMQAKASDKWAEYQADSIKSRIVETEIATSAQPSDSPLMKKLAAQSADWRDSQKTLQVEAKNLEDKRDEQLASGTRRLQERDLLGYAGVSIQLGIALASVAALTKKRAAFDIAIVVGLIGLLLVGYALFEHHKADKETKAAITEGIS